MKQPEPNYSIKSKLHLGAKGSIIQWDNAKGIGVVQVKPQDNQSQFDEWNEPINIVFHLSQLVFAEQSPKLGEIVTIKAQFQREKNSWIATEVNSPKREQAKQIQLKQLEQQIAKLKRQQQMKWLGGLGLVVLLVVLVWVF